MGFKNFRLNILFRIALLTFFLFVSIRAWLNTPWEVTPVTSALLAILCIIELVYYLENSNRKLKGFLEFIHHKEFAPISFSEGMGRSFAELEDAYRQISTMFQRLNAEKEANALYLESVVEHVNVALLCINEAGRITLLNRHAKSLFSAPHISSIDALRKIDKGLGDLVNTIQGNEHRLVNATIRGEKMQLSVHAINFQLLAEHYKLVSFQNIRDELEQHEISSWQKLISVLTHEIMNSVTPIISLSGVLKSKLAPDDASGIIHKDDPGEIGDIQKSLKSIESRSKGLQNFVQTYRRLTSVPAPNFEIRTVHALLENVQALMTPELESRGIGLEVQGRALHDRIRVDPQQIEQVLINLIKNSMEALADQSAPHINIRVEGAGDQSLVLFLSDNGTGIEEAYLDQVFIPFFTTKQNGTGIGLSISRQIMIQNHGMITATSSPGSGTTFQLRFNTV